MNLKLFSAKWKQELHVWLIVLGALSAGTIFLLNFSFPLDMGETVALLSLMVACCFFCVSDQSSDHFQRITYYDAERLIRKHLTVLPNPQSFFPLGAETAVVNALCLGAEHCIVLVDRQHELVFCLSEEEARALLRVVPLVLPHYAQEEGANHVL